VADHIVGRGRAERVLLVNVLEGGTPFYERVLGHLRSTPLRCEEAFVKVQRYTGSHADRSTEGSELLDATGRPVESLRSFDRVAVLDDLLDSGETLAWLVDASLLPLGARGIHAYFMLEKDVRRRPELVEVLRLNPLSGRRVPDEWIVGYGPNITLPGDGATQPLHLLRGELPGGMYAFNRAIEPRLTSEYRREPAFIEKQLSVYVTER
jgi:hypoxanthine-guanine phosphoribosyltransferase